MTGCQGDMSAVQGDMTDCQGDFTGVSGDCSGCEGDMGPVQGDVTGHNGDVSNPPEGGFPDYQPPETGAGGALHDALGEPGAAAPAFTADATDAQVGGVLDGATDQGGAPAPVDPGAADAGAGADYVGDPSMHEDDHDTGDDGGGAAG